MKRLFIIGLSLFIICFLAATLVWFGFEHKKFQINEYQKTFHQDADDLTVNLKSQVRQDVTIKKGQHFAIHYKGKRYIRHTHSNNHLTISEKVNKKDRYGMNFNPFRLKKDSLVITVPPKKLSSLKIHNVDGELTIKDIATKSLNLESTEYSNPKLNIEDSKIERLKYLTTRLRAHISNCEILGGKLKTDEGELKLHKTLLKNVAVINHENDINLTDMQPLCNFKASSDNGDIHLNYQHKPKDTSLKLNPIFGKEHIDNQYFKDYRVGNGNNKIELYTYYGDIYIK
ncbi:DUF4097 family beta strand repeat-containing protein [Staphylococcus pettenkoferi]|uniref:DUF4097 family beta strand repeat-containing protein n=1 Tax=Staphylococcus pettenkoferi TaxID=170573 RepID=UPI00066ECFD8|nr:DUF4097 family beta strand repeat-containing protein [Staphylococcus pettenkoferi]MCI2803888.1 DUF4097 domain-containing protein [Staphylococcus pettenkoferi]MCY1584928.1 DUF4097 domain-containing protein [Staphylococcus pettenkoferi]MCY1616158.1 DUF4097 domain-containing protein [Staphylococcus pettenkoferi]MCY1626044.1 DUF4097 domain-containing protein [Staphylococcus pettenkoferi]PNZ87829.1 hypothetical protein CD126_08270 [Staphylococcus pettenkoferi]